MSAATASNLNGKAFGAVEEWRCQVAAMLRAIHARESSEASMEEARAVAGTLDEMGLKGAARCVRDGAAETLAHARFPMEHRGRIRANNAIGRPNRGIRRRARVVGAFPDGKGALVLVTAGLEYVADGEWGSRRYLGVALLDERPCRWSAAACWNLRKSLDSTTHTAY